MKHVLSVLCLALGIAIAWFAPQLTQDHFNVTSLRGTKVALFDQPNGAVVGEVTSDEFKGPWPALVGTGDGHLQVAVDGKPVWVMAYMVQVERAGGLECGAIPESARRWLGRVCQG